MNFFKYLKSGITTLAVMAMSVPFVGCTDGPNNPKDKSNYKSTLLVYAVATNSLTGNLVSDKNEMLMAAPEIDLDRYNVLVFETQYKYLEDNTRVGNVNLLKLVKDNQNNDYIWETVKEYNDGVASLNPQRMTEVINYVTNTFPSDKYGLVLWSHSTGAQPDLTSTAIAAASEVSTSITETLPSLSWFGQDLSVADDEYKYMNIDVLANVLPDHLFDYIWFDSCYMSNIESIYQLRNKCNYYVGYPTEVLDSGLPYQYVLPYMNGDKEDLVIAAKAFYDYYSTSFGTVGVVDMNGIEALADFCKSVFGYTSVPSSSLVKFSRFSTGPFYDLGDYVKAMASENGSPITESEWNEVLDKCVLYKATTDGGLLRLYLNPETYSGISTHLYSFDGDDSDAERYYKSLDWFKAVF